MVERLTIKGWPVIPRGTDPKLKWFTVPGTDRKLLLRKDVGPYLVAFASEYHSQIAPIDEGTMDDWSWSPVRKGRASVRVSDHCGGVAIDLNATKEGSQSRSNVWWKKHPVKAMRMRALLKKYRLLEWGGDYKKFYDPMHITIHTPDVKLVKSEMAKLGILPSGKIKPTS
jgi:hypothetical protein